MELRDRKFIKNNKYLPGFEGGKENGVPPYLDNNAGSANWTQTMNSPKWGDEGYWNATKTRPFFSSDIPQNSYIEMQKWLNPTAGYTALDFKTDSMAQMKPSESGITPMTKPITTNSGTPTGGKTDPIHTKSSFDYGTAIQGVADTGMKIYSSFYNPVTPEQLLQQAGYKLMHAGDTLFTVQNAPDAKAETDRVRKSNTSSILGTTATGAVAGGSIGTMIMPGIGTAIGAGIGALVGGVGSAIGSIFTSAKSRRAIKQALLRQARQEAEAKSAAYTEYLQLKNLIAQGTGEELPMERYMRYKDGKAVHTSHGSAVRKLNSWGSAGETVVDTETGDWHVLPGIPNFKDTLPMFVRGKDAVLSNHGASQYFQATRDLDGALAMDLIYRATGTNAFKNGKFPRYADSKPAYEREGWWNNFIPSFAGLAASAGQVIGAYNDDIKRTDVNRTNRYASSALNKLAGLKINTIPITNEILNQKAIADNNVNSTYGLSAGQKARFRSLNMFNTQRALSKLGQEAQDRLNQYIAQLANVQAAIGNQEADRATKSNMFDDEMLAKAHAARHLMALMGMRNFIDSMQQWYANEFKRKQFNRTMNLYEQQLAIDLAKLNADIDYRKQLYKSPYAYFPVGMRAALSGGNGLWLA